MRIVIISDTHGRHDELPDLAGDVLIHCGDLCGDDDGSDLPAVDDWLSRQPFEHRLCIAGNHDFLIERLEQLGETPLFGAMLLHDREVIIDGLRFYGSPWVPDLPGWAYHLDDGLREARWRRIPQDTDVLITHAPPRGILDIGGDPPAPMGCPLLARRVEQVAPRMHCFGHVHASFGQRAVNGVQYINGAQIRGGKIVNDPVVIDL